MAIVTDNGYTVDYSTIYTQFKVGDKVKFTNEYLKLTLIRGFSLDISLDTIYIVGAIINLSSHKFITDSKHNQTVFINELTYNTPNDFRLFDDPDNLNRRSFTGYYLEKVE